MKVLVSNRVDAVGSFSHARSRGGAGKKNAGLKLLRRRHHASAVSLEYRCRSLRKQFSGFDSIIQLPTVPNSSASNTWHTTPFLIDPIAPRLTPGQPGDGTLIPSSRALTWTP